MASSSAFGTTTFASPIAIASSADTILAVAQISRARAYPTASTSGWVPVRSGTSPSADSFIHSWASSASTRRSQERASWKPAPMAYPCTTATDTNRGSRSQVKPRWNSSIAAEASSSGRATSPATVSAPSAAAGSSIARSSPAENDAPLPRSTTTRTSSGISAPSRARVRHISGVCALRTSGRSRVTTATSPVTSYASPAAVSSSGVMRGG